MREESREERREERGGKRSEWYLTVIFSFHKKPCFHPMKSGNFSQLPQVHLSPPALQ